MTIWRKHAALPALAAAIALILAIACRTYASKDGGTFELRDLSGDRAALEGIAIAGELRDGYHRTRFRLQDGSVATRTKLLRQPQPADDYQYVAGANKRIGDAEYSVGGSGPFDITKLMRRYNPAFFSPVGTASVSPYIVKRQSGGDDSLYVNPLEYGIARIGDRSFFTAPASASAAGDGLVYELNFYEWGLGSAVNKQDYVSRQIAAYPLGSDGKDVAGIDVLGLEAVGGKLALLTAEDGSLRVRSLDPVSGEWLGEARIADFPAPAEDGSYNVRYEAYPDEERNRLVLGFGGGGSRKLWIALDLTRGVEVLRILKTEAADGERDVFNNLSFARYADGKLIVVRAVREANDEPDRPSFDLSRPQHLYVEAYAASGLAYRGEIVTDVNDDSIEVAHRAAVNGAFVYDHTSFRYFTNIGIAGTEN